MKLLSLALLTPLLAAVALGAVPPKAKAKAEKPLPPCCRKVPAAGKPTETSLFQLESQWRSDAGKTVRLDVFGGRPVILTMFFSSCQFACPVLVHDLKRIEEALPPKLREQVDFVLVTFDTEKDTPEVLSAFRERQGLDAAHWSLLVGKPDDTRELAALLGVNYTREPSGQFAHSNTITVLNAQGEVAFQQLGLNRDPADVLRALTAATASPAPSK